MQTDSEEQEIRGRLRVGDSSVLEWIWDRYAPDLFGYAAGILRSRQKAEDVLQEVFVTIARKRADVAEAECLRAYLFRMARNCALNLLRTQSREQQFREDAESWQIAPGADPARGHDAERFRDALATLPEEQRSVVVLKVYEDMTFREIASAMGIPLHTAASRYRYALDKLRRLVGEETP